MDADILACTFSARQTAYIANVPYPTLDCWSKNYIGPSVQQATGRGSSRTYSFEDVVVLRIAYEIGALIGTSLMPRMEELRYWAGRALTYNLDPTQSPERPYIVLGEVVLLTHRKHLVQAIEDQKHPVSLVVDVVSVVRVCMERGALALRIYSKKKKTA